jgi:putative iron-dependent peroxidase
MSQPQPGITLEPREHARFVILRVPERTTSARLVARCRGRVPALAAKVSALDRRATLVCTVGIGPELWDSVSPHKRPKTLRQFAAIQSEGRTAPCTGGDLLLHILSKRPDLNFELARRLTLELGDSVAIMDDVAGFRYLDSRHLTGFTLRRP